MSTKEELYAAILANPVDTTLRLAYADLLDEMGDRRQPCPRCGGLAGSWYRIPGNRNCLFDPCSSCEGVGTILDTTNGDHARLIRAMVLGRHGGDPRFSCVKDGARDGVHWEWFSGGYAAALIPLLGPPFPSDAYFVFRDGFPSWVECPMGWWLSHGPKVVRRYPVVGVTLADRVPEQSGELVRVAKGQFGWWASRFGSLDEPEDLPEMIWLQLAGGKNFRRWKFYPTHDAANSALLDAAVRWARETEPAILEVTA